MLPADEEPLVRKQRRHLRRLPEVFESIGWPVFFLTLCVEGRVPCLANQTAADVLVRAWQQARPLYGWAVGRYVVMPEHIHVFVSPTAEPAATLSDFKGKWKSWTRREIRQAIPRFEWQDEFFDHLLRNNESYAQKWEYVRQNPVRAGLVERAEDWPWQGEIEPLIRW